MKQTVLIALLVNSLSAGAPAEDRAPRILSNKSSVEMSLDASKGERVLMFSRFGALNVVLKSTGRGPVLVTQSPGSEPKAVPVEGQIAMAGAAAEGPWVFLGIGEGGRIVYRLLNLQSGATTPVPVKGTPYESAILKDRLAVLTVENGRAMVSVFRCNALKPEPSVPVSVDATVTSLSFSKPDALLMIEHGLMRVTPVSVGDELKVGEPIHLEGSAVQDVLGRVGAAKQFTMPGYARNPMLILAHTTSRKGNNLLALGLPKPGEGATLVEFDQKWKQVAVYRLQAGAGPATTLGLVSKDGLIVTGDKTMVALGDDGILREFERP